MKTIRNAGIVVLVLAAAALGGAAITAAVGTEDEQAKPATLFAEWKNRPATPLQAFALGNIAVRATVASVEQADPITVAVPGEPGGVDTVATQRITFRTNEVLKGRLGDTFAVFRTGDAATSLEGDPAYAVGEEYVLFLDEQRPDGRHVLVSPEGRYAVEGGTVRAISERPGVAAVSGLSYESFRATLQRG